ncbi:hypothetical protein [Clostridium hydrogeniformans]|uniref:hypothetical protein n=1 Tax=Clostridium hydrogeniformans TaxID=349933 RepID=UPI00047FE3CB|nr:hypothetical protein [Clostridium hydrogeniformans]
MSHRDLMECQQREIIAMQEMLTRLINSYRLLIGGANELNGIALAKKSQVKDALKRAEALGSLIDDVADALKRCQCRYLDYCVMYSEEIKGCISPEFVYEDIQCELSKTTDKK